MRRSFELITGAIIWYTTLVSQRLPERILNMHASVKWALRLRETYVLCYPIQYRKFSLDIAIYSHFLLNLTHLNVSVVDCPTKICSIADCKRNFSQFSELFVEVTRRCHLKDPKPNQAKHNTSLHHWTKAPSSKIFTWHCHLQSFSVKLNASKRIRCGSILRRGQKALLAPNRLWACYLSQRIST